MLRLLTVCLSLHKVVSQVVSHDLSKNDSESSIGADESFKPIDLKSLLRSQYWQVLESPKVQQAYCVIEYLCLGENSVLMQGSSSKALEVVRIHDLNPVCFSLILSIELYHIPKSLLSLSSNTNQNLKVNLKYFFYTIFPQVLFS